jgi:hypothetical protein
MHYGLGAWLGVRDERSLNYRFTAAPVKGRTVLHAAGAPISNQGDLGGCVGWTDLDTLNYAAFQHSRFYVNRTTRYLANPQGAYFYHLSTLADEWLDEQYPPDDTGSSVLAGAKVLKQLGYVARYEWAMDFDSFLAAVQRQPVMVGTTWTDGMFDPDSKGVIRPTGNLAGGHAYSIRGVDFQKQQVRMRNHWTQEWGIRGEAFIGFDDMKWLLDQQGECLVPIPR